LGFEVLDWDEVIGMKFDLVVGNPPYQNGENSHFYKQFVDKAKTLSPVVAMVVPSSYFGNTSNFDNIKFYSYKGMNFKNVELSTSWFVWEKNYTGPRIC
jgi:predicted RNA methylase